MGGTSGVYLNLCASTNTEYYSNRLWLHRAPRTHFSVNMIQVLLVAVSLAEKLQLENLILISGMNGCALPKQATQCIISLSHLA